MSGVLEDTGLVIFKKKPHIKVIDRNFIWDSFRGIFLCFLQCFTKCALKLAHIRKVYLYLNFYRFSKNQPKKISAFDWGSFEFENLAPIDDAQLRLSHTS